MPTIGIHSLVTRQTPGSRFSHFDGTLQQVAVLGVEHFDAGGKPGYREGVRLVSVPAAGFFSGVVEVTPDTDLRATFEARSAGEDPYLSVVAVGGEKLPALHVELVLYRRDVLLEDGPDAAKTGADWELISINARPTAEDEPMTPMAMARNMLSLPGGTEATYTAEEFARAILYWSCRANIAETA